MYLGLISLGSLRKRRCFLRELGVHVISHLILIKRFIINLFVVTSHSIYIA